MNKWWKKDKYILSFAIIAFILISFALQFIKYRLFLYNGLDLAIFNNLFYNLTHGGGFFSSIQGHIYLADHFPPLLFVFWPFYKIFNHPLTLLLLQTAILGLTGLVIYKLSQIFFTLKINSQNTLTKKLPLIFALVWLINPLVWNINFYEFHILILLLPLFLATLIFYFKNNFFLFSLFSILTCLVREDAALLVFALGVIAWFDKKPKKYILTPLIISVLLFLGAIFITSLFSAEGFRFAAYYQWLGETPRQALANFFLKPWLWLGHILSLSNLNMLVGFLFPFLFLPLKKPKYLLLAFLPLVQFMFSAQGGSNVVVQTHYATFFLPALLLASLDAVAELINKKTGRLRRLFAFDPVLSKIIIPTVLILSWLALSPLGLIILESDNLPAAAAQARTWEKNLNEIANNTDKSIAAGLNLIPRLSTRSDIYAVYYLFPEFEQFSNKKYTPKEPIETIAIDQDELVYHWLKVSSQKNAVEIYQERFFNWQELLADFRPDFLPPNLVLYHHSNLHAAHSFYLPQFPMDKEICWQENFNKTYNKIVCQFFEPINQIYFLRVNSKGKIIPAIWRERSGNNNTAWAVFFLKKGESSKIKIEKIKIQGQTELGPWLKAVNKIYKTEKQTELELIR